MPAYNARVAFEGHASASGALVTNVLHVECDVLTSPPNWQSIAVDIYTWLGTLWNNVLPTSYVFDQVVVTDDNYPGSTHGQGVAIAGIAGARTVTDTNLDPASCAVGSLKTAVAKRYARGHIFFAPALSSNQTAGGGLWSASGPYLVACKAFLDAYKAGHTVQSTGYVPIVFSKHQVLTGQAQFTFPVTGASVGLKQHWLRSRSTAP